jgi:putative toxin-antitoxin system antitoxin component (TIGR02293 family)
MKTYNINQSLPELNEAVAEYITQVQETNYNNSNSFSFSEFIEDKILVIKSIRQGISYKLFKAILSFSPFTDEEWAEYLNISSKSLQRYSKTKDFHFKPIHSEKILEIAEVTAFGKEVFQDSAQFYGWLNTPSLALNNLTPAELLKDSYGKELVMAELNRIDHGIFA